MDFLSDSDDDFDADLELVIFLLFKDSDLFDFTLICFFIALMPTSDCDSSILNSPLFLSLNQSS